MARYEHLPVFQSVYKLILYFYNLSCGFPKDHKYTIAQEIKVDLMKLADLIIIANNSVDKTKVIARAILVIENIKIKNRLLSDMKVTRMKSYEYFSRELVDISKQIEKWFLWAKKG